MKLLGCGLPRTGTTSLTGALLELGFRATNDSQCLPNEFGEVPYPPFVDVFDHWEAIVGYLASYYAERIHAAIGCGAIVLTRDPDDWFDSIEWLYENKHPGCKHANKLHFGSSEPDRKIWTDHFARRNREIVDALGSDALMLDVCADDGWEKLCPFLGVEIPDTPFPRLNGKDAWIGD